MLPVTLLTGFLGGGKTTLLRRLLQSPWGGRIGILMNERGTAGIDDLGEETGRAKAGFIELSEGCVCCVEQPNLVAALEALVSRGDLDRIVLETTGLADPLPIAWTVARPDLSGQVVLDAVVTVVDAANQERTRVEEWTAQVRAADLVVLSKLDLAGAPAAERARAAVRELNPRARILEGDEGLLALVGPEAVFGGRAPRSTPAERPLARHSDFQTISFAGVKTYDSAALEDALEELPPEVFRAKGIARVEGGWLAFQAVGGRVRIDPDAAAPPHGQSRLAFFGRRLDEAALAARLEAAQSHRAR